MNKTLDLRRREWVAVILLAAGFLFLSKSSLQTPESRWPTVQGKPIKKPASLFVIRVQGAVEKPGVYQFAKGTTIGEVLKMCGVLSEANLKGIDLNQPIKKGQKLTVKGRIGKNDVKRKDIPSQKSSSSANLSHTSPLQTSSETADSTV